MNWARSAALSAALLFATTLPALSWGVWTEGPDVFGAHKALASANNGRNSIVVQCDNEDTLFLAFLRPIKEFEEVPELAATFLVQIDDGTPRRFDASSRNWNKDNAGIVISGRTRELADLVLSLASAKSRINIGVELNGARDSASFSARGSTAAIKKIDTTCELSAIQNSEN